MVIHLDPVQIHDPRTQKLYHQIKELLVSLSPQYSMHDFRVVWGTTHTNLIFDVVVPFGEKESDREIMHRIQKSVSELLGENYFTMITIDHSYL